MKRDEIVFLEDILIEIDKIEKTIKNLDYPSFEKDSTIKDATFRRIEVIGEAAKHISENTKKKYPEVEWKKIVGTRDVLIHAYFGVLDLTIWNVVKKEIPLLKKQIKKIKKELEDSK